MLEFIESKLALAPKIKFRLGRRTLQTLKMGLHHSGSRCMDGALCRCVLPEKNRLEIEGRLVGVDVEEGGAGLKKATKNIRLCIRRGEYDEGKDHPDQLLSPCNGPSGHTDNSSVCPVAFKNDDLYHGHEYRILPQRIFTCLSEQGAEDCKDKYGQNQEWANESYEYRPDFPKQAG